MGPARGTSSRPVTAPRRPARGGGSKSAERACSGCRCRLDRHRRVPGSRPRGLRHRFARTSRLRRASSLQDSPPASAGFSIGPRVTPSSFAWPRPSLQSNNAAPPVRRISRSMCDPGEARRCWLPGVSSRPLRDAACWRRWRRRRSSRQARTCAFPGLLSTDPRSSGSADRDATCRDMELARPS